MMISEARFFRAALDGLLGPELTNDEVTGCAAILSAMAECPISWTAYALATAYAFTSGTMQPTSEAGDEAAFFDRYDPAGSNPALAAQLGNIEEGDGARFCGRGFLPLTGGTNYERASAACDRDLVSFPAEMLQLEPAARSICEALIEGWITGKTLAEYLPTDNQLATLEQFSAAQLAVGVDLAPPETAEVARSFQQALIAGHWM